MPDIIAVNKELTEWFIANGPPSVITLVPQVEVKVAGKGIKREPGIARDPQEFKKIWPGGDGFVTSGEDGTHHRLDLILVGVFDCEGEIGDVWSEGDQSYYIHSEFPFNGYERKFGCYSYGKSPSDG